jgi:uronate dehydrogenase
MNRYQKIILTGAAGKIGRRMREPLARQCRQLVATDIVPLAPVAPNESVQTVDLTDAAAVRALVEGADAIVHFAGYPREAGWDVLLPANVLALTHLWEAALASGVQRVVYASTNHVVGMHARERMLTVHDEIKCDSRYGVTKAFAETLARFYYEKYGISSLGIRIGRCEDKPTDERMLSTWIHPDDLAQLLALGLHHPVRADIVFGISDNSRATCRNPSVARFPYHPAHRADDHPLAAPSGAAQPSYFQGGPFADADFHGIPERAAGYLRDQPSADTP